MESLLHLLLFLPVLLILFFIQKQRTTKKPTPQRPPGPRGLPIVGNLHQLDNSKLYLQLWQLSKTYGPFFSLQLGSRPALVVSSAKMAKNFLKSHDLEVSGRPATLAQQKLSYNGLDIVFSPYNDYWREIRKITAIHILSSKRVSSFSSIRRFEVLQMMNKISVQSASSKVTNLTETLTSLTGTIICRIALGKGYEREGTKKSKFQELLNESHVLMGTFFVSDFIPLMGWIDKVSGLFGRLQRNFEEHDKFLQRVINEHLNPNRQSDEEDIVDVLLQLNKHHSFSFDLTYEHIKAVVMDILAGATDSTATTLIWVMVELMKNSSVMNKVQAEIRKLCGEKDFIEEGDIHKLSYFKAVIKETLRIHPPNLLIPRETTKKITIEGYEIQEKTFVYVNVWAIHRDPEAWSNPEEFYPDRFFDYDVDFKGQDFELIPFGFGRRTCPGLHMAVTTAELILANLLCKFNWEMPTGMNKEDINTEVRVGITNQKKTPLCLVAKNYA